MPRNPNCTRDELILALDLFFRVNPLHTSENNPEIIALSDLLNALPIHSRTEQSDNFRNPSGVYMKLCNFLRLDPNYQGKGLYAGSKLDEEVWNEFTTDRQRLDNAVSIIKSGFSRITPPRPNTIEAEEIEDEEFPEGRIVEKLHKERERKPRYSKKKKEQVLRLTGKLECEVCGFDFAYYYGKYGYGFAECYHVRPLAELKIEGKTKLKDLAIVCANCHRMLHRIRLWLTVSQLQGILQFNGIPNTRRWTFEEGSTDFGELDEPSESYPRRYPNIE